MAGIVSLIRRGIFQNVVLCLDMCDLSVFWIAEYSTIKV